MSKPDVTRNYYKELGVPFNADEGEIRRAFRQLALKYHPDRNPGREAESVAKFQQIQAAHEILSDTALRSKYDDERRKRTDYYLSQIPPYKAGPRPAPPSRNAYTTTTPSGSYYRAPAPPPTQQRPPPPQHQNTYTNGADRFTGKNFRAPPPKAQSQNPRPTDAEARAHVFTAWQHMKGKQDQQARQARGPQPRTYPNGVPFGRSHSTRTPPSKTGFDPATPGGDEGQARSSYRSNFERPAASPPHNADPLRHFKEQVDPNIPYAEANRVRTPYYSSTTGERTSMYAEGVNRSSSVRNSPTHRPVSSEHAGSFSDSGGRKQRNSYPAGRPKVSNYSSSSDDGDSDRIEKSANASKEKQSPPHQKAPVRQSKWERDASGNLVGGAEAGANAFKSRSEESINMKFSPSDWHGKFEGKPDYFAPSKQKGGINNSKGRTSPTRGRPQQRTASERVLYSGQSQPPPGPSPFSQMPPPPPPPVNPPTQFPTAAAAPHASKFEQEQWKDSFKEPSWAYSLKPKETPGSASSTKRPKASGRKPSVIQSGATSTETPVNNSKPKHQAFAEDEANSNDDAMDIDSSTPQGMQGEGSRTAAGGRATAPSSATESRAPGDLGGLSNVEPFLPSTNGGGLSGLQDVKSSLPFESRASDTHPTNPNTARKLKIPLVPMAPAVPDVLSDASARKYFSQMSYYLKSYREWNKIVSSHMTARQTELDDKVDGNIVFPTFGPGTNRVGFSDYTNMMCEDEYVLQAWKVGHESHVEAMRQCTEFRKKAAKHQFGGIVETRKLPLPRERTYEERLQAWERSKNRERTIAETRRYIKKHGRPRMLG